MGFIRHKIKTKYSPIILIVGKMRSGKTFLSLRMAYELDNNFNVEKQMFFDIYSFAKAVDSSSNKVLIVDEAGIELDAYRYADVRQRAFSHIIQSQAYKNNTLFIVLPHASDMAKCHRKYVDVLLVVPTRGAYKAYSPFVPMHDMNDINFLVKKMEEVRGIPLPPSHIVNSYKTKFEKQIKQDILEKEIDKLDRYLAKTERSEKLTPITTLV